LRPQLRWIGNVADPTYKQEVIRFAERKGVDLQLLISISDERLVELLNTAKLMMYAPHLEPFGYAPLEANACGLPVVAIAEGGVRETVEHDVNGLLAEALPECMAAAATSLLKDEGYRMQMGRKAAEHVRSKWSHIAAVDRIEKELAEVAGAAIPSSKYKTDSSVTTR
jgi:glycosyltransferase involved in cell wall biosynthesis